MLPRRPCDSGSSSLAFRRKRERVAGSRPLQACERFRAWFERQRFFSIHPIPKQAFIPVVAREIEDSAPSTRPFLRDFHHGSGVSLGLMTSCFPIVDLPKIVSAVPTGTAYITRSSLIASAGYSPLASGRYFLPQYICV